VLGLVLAARPAAAAPCPHGYHLFDAQEVLREMRGGASEEFANAERQAEEREREAEERAREQSAERSSSEQILCIADKHPETYGELRRISEEAARRVLAPLDRILPGANRAALAERSAIIASGPTVAGAAGTWVPYGSGTLIGDDPAYSVSQEGLGELSGRVDSLEYDAVNNRLFASIGTGGVWMSTDVAKTWHSIGDSLPSQIVGAIGWTSGGGGTLIAVSGEPLMGGNTYAGLGAFYTRDLGKTWHQAAGVPDGALGFNVAADPTKPNIVYVATSKGLYRSTDAGATFVNTKLPTGECAGKTDIQKCLLANFVTDVIVQSPDTFGNTGGTVLAAVGFRAGNAPFADSTIPQSPANGFYRSSTGAPGTFTKLAAPGFAKQDKIGRLEIGGANGPDQNHDYVYAILEDAKLFAGGAPVIDAVEDVPFPLGANNTVLNGVYVSPDFGDTWTQMADETTISESPLTGSALIGYGQATFYAPGAQSWYNMWIHPDPTRQSSEGVPTRLGFGLEEVWDNVITSLPQDGTSLFHVIGRYFAGTTCLFLGTGLPVCPTNQPPTESTTTHPDQHDAVWIPDGKGGVTLVVGNDGGVFTQHVAEGEELDNIKWGRGANVGFNTLLPYQGAVAKDGTIWFGLQDNGSGKLDPKTGKLYETIGGDGFYAAVDPNNSNIAWTEATQGAMSVTTDGGKNWEPVDPPVDGAQFANPFVMDPLDANHLLTAGQQVVETVDGPDTAGCNQLVCNSTWVQVFDLGAGKQMSSVDLQGDAAYVGFCGLCDPLRFGKTSQFHNGLATNIGGKAPAKRVTSAGWHKATAKGLPNRYITAIAIDPKDPKTVYVALGGYANRQWIPPGSFGDKNLNLGRGHVFRSTDVGEHFTDISANLPDTPAFALELRGNQVIVGTNIGVFMSSTSTGGTWAALANGLPVLPIGSLQIHPGDPSVLIAATYGRGFWAYRFPSANGAPTPAPTVRGVKNTRPLPSTGVGSKTLPAILLLLGAGLLVVLIRRRRV
jgi:photosystem II stability/assembly factor-like uncharacterized protein